MSYIAQSQIRNNTGEIRLSTSLKILNYLLRGPIRAVFGPAHLSNLISSPGQQGPLSLGLGVCGQL